MQVQSLRGWTRGMMAIVLASWVWRSQHLLLRGELENIVVMVVVASVIAVAIVMAVIVVVFVVVTHVIVIVVVLVNVVIIAG